MSIFLNKNYPLSFRYGKTTLPGIYLGGGKLSSNDMSRQSSIEPYQQQYQLFPYQSFQPETLDIISSTMSMMIMYMLQLLTQSPLQGDNLNTALGEANQPVKPKTTSKTRLKGNGESEKFDYNNNKSIEKKLRAIAGGGILGNAALDMVGAGQNSSNIKELLKSTGHSESEISQFLSLAKMVQINTTITSLNKIAKSSNGLEATPIQKRINALKKAKSEEVKKFEKLSA